MKIKRIFQKSSISIICELDDKVRRVLRLFFRTTMSDKRAQGFLCSEAHHDAAMKIAQEGIVLLQNKRNVLPIDISKAKRVQVVGENAIKMMTVGGGSSSLKAQHEILPLEGLKNRLAARASRWTLPAATWVIQLASTMVSWPSNRWPTTDQPAN